MRDRYRADVEIRSEAGRIGAVPGKGRPMTRQTRIEQLRGDIAYFTEKAAKANEESGEKDAEIREVIRLKNKLALLLSC